MPIGGRLPILIVVGLQHQTFRQGGADRLLLAVAQVGQAKGLADFQGSHHL